MRLVKGGRGGKVYKNIDIISSIFNFLFTDLLNNSRFNAVTFIG